MRVEYYKKVIDALVTAGCSEAEIARAMGKSRTAVNTMRGKNKNQAAPEDLSGTDLAVLLELCRKHKIRNPRTWNQLGKSIESELRKTK